MKQNVTNPLDLSELLLFFDLFLVLLFARCCALCFCRTRRAARGDEEEEQSGATASREVSVLLFLCLCSFLCSLFGVGPKRRKEKKKRNQRVYARYSPLPAFYPRKEKRRKRKQRCVVFVCVVEMCTQAAATVCSMFLLFPRLMNLSAKISFSCVVVVSVQVR